MSFRSFAWPALLTAVLPLPAQTPSWSPEYATAGLGGRVLACTSYNGDLYAGGWWAAAKGGVIRGIGRFDGREWHPVASGVELVNNVIPFTEPEVRAMAVFGGELVFAGTFDRAGGQAIDQIARWDGSTLRPLGAGLRLSYGDAEVRALAVYNNELYAAGLFDLAGGAPVEGIARWDGAVWRPVSSGLRSGGGAAPAHPYALGVHGGRLFAGGDFDRAGGQPAQYVAAWDGATWSALGAGALSPVRAFAAFGNDLVAAGQFSFATGTEMLGAWTGTSWHALGQGGPDLPVLALTVFAGHLWAGGGFVAPGPHLARFDGTTWSVVGGVAGVFSGVNATSVYALTTHGAELVVGGEFTTADRVPGAVGAVRSANVAAFDGTSWRSLGGGLGIDRPARALLSWRGRLIAAGGFSETGAVRAVGIAAFDGDRWQPFGVLDGGVAAAVVFAGDLIVSGAFTSIDGQPFPGIARHDGTRWSACGGIAPPGLHVHGNELFGFGATGLLRWNGSAFVTVALPTTVVSHLHSHVDGRLYATSDTAFTHSVYRWTGSQLQQIGAPDDFVHCLGSFGSELLVGGRFRAVDGVPAALLARFDGTAWRAMPASLSGYAVDGVTEFDGSLHVGVNGEPRGFLLRWSGTGWQPLDAGLDGVPSVFLADPAVASLMVSGPILTAGGLPALNLAQWCTQPAWRNRLHGLAGAAGFPLLSGRGPMAAGTTASFVVTAPQNLPVAFVLGATRRDLPLLGGTLVPSPDLVLGLGTGANGSATLGLVVPPGLRSGVALFSQAWLFDASGPFGLTATNALECRTR